MRDQAIFKTHPNVISYDEEHGCFDKNGNLVAIDESLVEAKLTELQNAEPMRLLREERNRKPGFSFALAVFRLNSSLKNQDSPQATLQRCTKATLS